MALTRIQFPALPTPPSWFPGHMNKFMKNLPALLRRTDVILEMRDSRLPLTSINPNFEYLLQDWTGKGKGRELEPGAQFRKRIIVLSKMDLVPHWGIEVGT